MREYAARDCLLALLFGACLAASAAHPLQAPGRYLASPSARYLYSAPSGPHRDISAVSGIATLQPTVNIHPGGYDYPIQFTRGRHGWTTFDDVHWYHYRDRMRVPNISPSGGFAPSTGTDGHLVVIDTATGTGYDFWRLCVGAGGVPVTCRGNASPTSVGRILAFSLDSSNGAPGGCTASGLTGLAGDILPGELATGAAVPHALSVIVPGAMNRPGACPETPATHSDGTVSGAVFCEGAKLRMDPAVGVDALTASPAAKAIMKALQRYGGIITDQSDCARCLGFYSDLRGPAPDLTGLAPNLLAHLWIYYGRR